MAETRWITARDYNYSTDNIVDFRRDYDKCVENGYDYHNNTCTHDCSECVFLLLKVK